MLHWWSCFVMVKWDTLPAGDWLSVNFPTLLNLTKVTTCIISSLKSKFCTMKDLRRLQQFWVKSSLLWLHQLFFFAICKKCWNIFYFLKTIYWWENIVTLMKLFSVILKILWLIPNSHPVWKYCKCPFLYFFSFCTWSNFIHVL